MNGIPPSEIKQMSTTELMFWLDICKRNADKIEAARK